MPCSLDDFILCSCEVHRVPQSMYIINISTLPLLKGAPNIYLAIVKKNMFFSHKMLKSPVIPPKFIQNLTQKYMLMVFFGWRHQNLHPIWTAAVSQATRLQQPLPPTSSKPSARVIFNTGNFWGEKNPREESPQAFSLINGAFIYIYMYIYMCAYGKYLNWFAVLLPKSKHGT